MSQHILEKLSSIGCTDANKDLAIMFYQSTNDVYDWKDLVLKYCSRLNKIYFTSRNGTHTIVPLNIADRISMASLNEFFSLQPDCKSVTVAIYNVDGVMVHYELGDNLQTLEDAT